MYFKLGILSLYYIPFQASKHSMQRRAIIYNNFLYCSIEALQIKNIKACMFIVWVGIKLAYFRAAAKCALHQTMPLTQKQHNQYHRAKQICLLFKNGFKWEEFVFFCKFLWIKFRFHNQKEKTFLRLSKLCQTKTDYSTENL